jgi:hypothetical protein
LQVFLFQKADKFLGSKAATIFHCPELFLESAYTVVLLTEMTYQATVIITSRSAGINILGIEFRQKKKSIHCILLLARV